MIKLSKIPTAEITAMIITKSKIGTISNLLSTNTNWFQNSLFVIILAFYVVRLLKNNDERRAQKESYKIDNDRKRIDNKALEARIARIK